MSLTKKQKQIIIGLILGDGFLQKTGLKNARLRLEYSSKSEKYARWILGQLSNIFPRIHKLERIHPLNQRRYGYIRLQSHASPFFGKLQKKFYLAGKKSFFNANNYLNNWLTLGVWYLDDGHYIARDKQAEIYLPKLTTLELTHLCQFLYEQFNLVAKPYCYKNKNGCRIRFDQISTKILMKDIDDEIKELIPHKFH